MAQSDINIDQIVDYKSEYWPYIKKAKHSGNSIVGLCPFHDDHNNSFSVDLKTGKWHCHAEDTGGNFVSFYAKIHGVDTKEAYKEILERYGIDTSRGESERKKNARSYTLKQYAAEKHLPEGWLASECYLSTAKEKDGTTYLKEPYIDEYGREQTHRRRYAKKELKWKWGSSGKIGLYGEWRLPQVRSAGYTVLVEGESDTQSLWYMGISAMGVPGASMFKPKQSDLLQDLKLYIHKEPDHGGEVFLQKTLQGLAEGGFIGEAYVFSCSSISGCKDPSDVLVKFGKEEAAAKVMKLIGAAKKVDPAEKSIPVAIEGAPVNLRQPAAWVYSDKGILHINEKDETRLVCRTPIILTKRLKSLDAGDEKMEIAFKRDGEWHSAIFPRSTIFTSRGITALADLGCTVTSENAKGVVQFLAALEAENIDLIAKSDSTSTFGWQPGGRFVPGYEGDIVLDIDPSQRAMADAYRKQGSFDGWVETMRPHRERDKFRFLLAAAFAAPLLKIVRQRIFFVYVWGSSKTGKTAGLKAALSVWGNPEHLMVNFNATQVGLERTAAFFCDLPLGIDERQLAGRNQESIEKIIYMISSGTGKIRGAKAGGIQAMQTWRTVALATGEEPLSGETTMTGVSSRVLEVYGGPFENERQASAMHQKAPENCGWAGPAFIEHVVGMDEADIVSKYEKMQEFVNSISEGRSGSHVAGVSAVALADAMIDQWFFGGDPEAAWARAQNMARSILQEQMAADTNDVNENAVQFVVDWVTSNKAFFGEKAIGTCLGTMSESGNTAYIFPSVLNQALSKVGFSPRKTLKYMADKGLITATERKDHKGKTYQVVKWFDNRSCKFVEFHIGKLAEKRDELEEDDADPGQRDASKKQEKHKQMEMGDGFVPVKDGMDLPFD